MTSKECANYDPRSFFYYKGDYYINGTEIVLSDYYINTHTWNGRKLWKYARYDHQTLNNGSVAYFFCINRSDWLSLREMGLDPHAADDYAPYFVIRALDLESAIQEFAKPIKLNRVQTEVIKQAIVTTRSDFDNATLIVLWLIYIFVMIGSLIFKQFYIVWIIASVIFFKCRREMLN